MKKLMFMLMAVLLLGGIGGPAYAQNYSVALTTFQADNNGGAVVSFAATYPNIAEGIKIRKLIFESTNVITTPVLIRVYDTATSTTAASIDGYWVLSGTNAVNGNNRLEVDYPQDDPGALFYTDPGFYSDTAQTTVKVYMTIIYE